MDNEYEEPRQAVVESLILQLPNITDRASMSLLVEQNHIADIMEALRELPEEYQTQLLELMEPEDKGELFEEANELELAEYSEEMAPAHLAQVVESMAPDEAADLLETMSKSRAESILSLMPREDASSIRELLSYEPDTAGGIMTNDFFHVSPEMTKAQVLEHLHSEEREEENLDCFVVCRPDMKFLGLLEIEELLQAKPDAAVNDIMERAAVTVGPNADQEVCARYMYKYEQDILPVLDPRRRIVGIITSDDIMDVMHEEAAEDMYRMAGVGSELPLEEGPVARAFKRLPWFIVTFIGMSILGMIISRYGDTIQKIVAISFFIPAIMGLSGNVGLQAATITVRGLAMGEIVFKDIFWLLKRELLVGMIIGLVCGTSLAVVSAILAPPSQQTQEIHIKHGQLVLATAGGERSSSLENAKIIVESGEKDDAHPPVWGIIPRFPITVALAMFAGIMGSVMMGTCVPMLCHRCGVDPALASGPFVTTIIDIGTQTLYLSLATWLLVN